MATVGRFGLTAGRATIIRTSPYSALGRLAVLSALVADLSMVSVGAAARRRIVIVTAAEAPLASWSLSPAAVKRIMKGSDRPWMSIRKPTADLDVIINCAAFHRQVPGILRSALDKPFQQIDIQQEVIVKMPPVMWVPSRRITICS